MTFTQKILAATGAGIAAGLLLSAIGGPEVPVWTFVVDGVFQVVGRIFIALLQMMVVPLVLVSLVCGVTALGDLRALGRVGGKTLALYLMTTAIALVIALTLAAIVAPGEGFTLAGDESYEIREAPPISQVLIDMFPSNPVRALAEGQMLQIIVFALFLGFALTRSGQAGARVIRVFEDLNDIIMRMVLLVIRTAPIGVFALIAQTFATQGVDVFRPLLSYFFVVVAGLALHLTVTYTSLVRLSGLSVVRFLGKLRAVMTFAFSTSSSSATIPLTLSTLEHRFGVRNTIASFTVPLGATINMDGTAIMQGVATVFIANVYAIDLSLADYATVILTATLASIGTAAVPSAGLIMLAMVLGQIGLPVQGIALILGIDRLLDMMRTAVNVCGDTAVTLAVARSEDAVNLAVYDDPDVVLDERTMHHSL